MQIIGFIGSIVYRVEVPVSLRTRLCFIPRSRDRGIWR